jgi:hypothetical protein
MPVSEQSALPYSPNAKGFASLTGILRRVLGL